MDEVETGTWLPVSEAAARMGISVDAMRKRVKREQVQSRLGNDGKVQVLVGVETEGGHGLDTVRTTTGQAVELEEAKEAVERWRTAAVEAQGQLGRLEERLAASERREATLQADLDRERAELARLRKPLWQRVVETLRKGPTS